MKKKSNIVEFRGVKGERVLMVQRQNRRIYKGHAQSYEDTKRADLLFAAVLCFIIGIGCIALLVST